MWSSPPLPHGGHLPPNHPQDHDIPELPWPGGGCRPWEDLRRYSGGNGRGSAHLFPGVVAACCLRGTHAHCLRARVAWDQEQVGPHAPCPTLTCTDRPPEGPTPCCFSICLITKQKLQSGLLYFCMWNSPRSPVSSQGQYWLGHRSSPLKRTSSPPCVS